jgi:hypothetical protein
LFLHWTFALTDDAPMRVKVQVLRLLPLLEQAPDQIASRPLVTLNVIEVPVANDADPELPTLTLMPAGLDVTRSPLRPDAVTVSVAVVDEVDPCGVKRRTAENGPKTPAEFCARTRHQNVCAGKPAANVACDAVVVGLATNGAEIVDVSSTWTS